jgi:hypothetical protein
MSKPAERGKFRFVFELHPHFVWQGQRHPTGGTTGVLFSSLDGAMQGVGEGPWHKRPGANKWDTENGDIITRRKVKP